MVWLIARTITITNIIFRYAKIRNYLTQKTQNLLIAIKQKITTFATQK